MRLLLRYTSALCLALFMLACSAGAGRKQGHKPMVAVTISPTKGIIHALAGEQVEVLTLLPEGATPESYEPSMQDMSRLAHADAWLYVGDLGFEQSWLSRIKELNPDLKLIRLDSGLMPLQGHEHIHADGSVHSSDPHYWMSITGIEIMSRNVERALQSLLPEADLAHGADSIQRQLAQLRAWASERPFESKSFVIYHPSLAYFAEEQGLKQLVLEQDGKEPTIHHLKTLVEQAQRDHARLMFFQREFGAGSKSIDYIQREVDLRIQQINPFSADWFGELKTIITALQN